MQQFAFNFASVVLELCNVFSAAGKCTTEPKKAKLDFSKPGFRGKDFAEHGFKCQVWARPTVNIEEALDRRTRRFMGEGAAWNYIAMQEAIDGAGLSEDEISNPMTGIIMGSGGPSTRAIVEAADKTRESGGTKKVGPTVVPKAMSSTNSATLSVPFKILGVNYSISSACTTSLHCIGAAAEQIMWGKQDIVFAGGGEECDWTLANLFDAMGAMSTNFNDTPQTASRAYDKDRDGFVIAGGAGVVVLEDLERATARGAKIYGEVKGYGLSGDAHHITAPAEDGNGGFRSMEAALKRAGLDVSEIDYINAHGTSTPLGDVIEANAVRRLLGAESDVSMSSTKSSTGHLLGAAGAIEAIISTMAVEQDIVPPTLNLREPEPTLDGLDLVPLKAKKRPVRNAMSNSFGFGGTNASLIIGKVDT